MRLLLVEDELQLARTYQRHLERAGHHVEALGSAELAYARLMGTRPETYDALVLDVLLPGENGIALTRRLRHDGARVPILLLTALDRSSDVVAGLDAGADDYLTKPFPMDVLLARLRALGRRPHVFDPVANATQIHVGELVVDELQHAAYQSGHEIALTPREFTLLAYLARNANRVLTREQLTLHVWPEGTEAASNVLDTYIHHLRSKLARSGGERLIQTVRGVGYVLRSVPGGPGVAGAESASTAAGTTDSVDDRVEMR
jgi:DNA-binding response OmpR family regulator